MLPRRNIGKKVCEKKRESLKLMLLFEIFYDDLKSTDNIFVDEEFVSKVVIAYCVLTHR